MTDANARAVVSEDGCPYCDGVEEVEAVLADGSRDFVPCPHPCHRAAFATPAPVDREAMGEALHTAFMSGDTNKLTTTSLPGEWPNLTPSFAEEWRKVADRIIARFGGRGS
ncbi:MAG TPA: hypothetical protein VF695_11115 [Sphingomonas sp.]|jgi:hypothetical protein